MKTLTKLALGTVAASTGLMVGYAPAQAALIGDTVMAEYVLNGNLFASGTEVVVDPGIEFAFPTGNGGNISLDVKNDSFDIVFDLTGFSGIGYYPEDRTFDSALCRANNDLKPNYTLNLGNGPTTAGKTNLLPSETVECNVATETIR
ncbi:hypothetical protein VB715_08840 [Crocosphaera sp. UHCC 0190]|uniref:hypothetical protein n=1 Tax=Crocosphaera sp. UHCC 0190 TaxID=3110246 RepID=UPI002B215400|nr:hypothetical protein [Crocosphaera sp. UHCC 0190]MEA5509868.1 hypothetical protein [Crocosphaera sp. UHCC 0190]